MDENVFNPPKIPTRMGAALIGLAVLPLLTPRPRLGGMYYRDPPTPAEVKAAKKAKRKKKIARDSKRRNRAA